MSAKVLQKPQLRRLLERDIKKMLIQGTAFSIVCAAAWHWGHTVPLEKATEEFWRTYDVEAHLKQLNESGYMQSAPKKK